MFYACGHVGLRFSIWCFSETKSRNHIVGFSKVNCVKFWRLQKVAHPKVNKESKFSIL